MLIYLLLIAWNGLMKCTIRFKVSWFFSSLWEPLCNRWEVCRQDRANFVSVWKKEITSISKKYDSTACLSLTRTWFTFYRTGTTKSSQSVRIVEQNVSSPLSRPFNSISHSWVRKSVLIWDEHTIDLFLNCFCS